MCGTSKETKKAAADQSQWTSSMKAEAAQVFGTSSRVVNDLINTAEGIWAAGPSQQGFSAAQQNAMNASAITNSANATRFEAGRAGAAGAMTPGGVGRFGGGQSTGGTGVPAATASIYQRGAEMESNALNQIQQQNWAQGNQNWQVAGKTLGSAPSIFDAVTPFNSSAQTGLDRNMANAQAADAASNWWVKPVTSLAMGGLSLATGGLSSLASGSGSFMGGVSNMLGASPKGNNATSGAIPDWGNGPIPA